MNTIYNSAAFAALSSLALAIKESQDAFMASIHDIPIVCLYPTIVDGEYDYTSPREVGSVIKLGHVPGVSLSQVMLLFSGAPAWSDEWEYDIRLASLEEIAAQEAAKAEVD